MEGLQCRGHKESESQVSAIFVFSAVMRRFITDTSQKGQEYWAAVELMGQYAAAISTLLPITGSVTPALQRVCMRGAGTARPRFLRGGPQIMGTKPSRP